MDAAQCGLLVGVRPIIEYLATPFWHGMSDRYQYIHSGAYARGGDMGTHLPPGPVKFMVFRGFLEAISSIITLVDHMTSLNFGRTLVV